MVKKAGEMCENPGLVIADGPTKNFTVALVEGILSETGVKLAKTVTVPLAATDYAPQAAQITQGTDCILGGLARTQWESFMPAFAQSGGTQKLFGTKGNLAEFLTKKFPQQGKDGIAVGWYPDISTDAFEDFRGAIEQYDPPDEDYAGDGALGAWTGYVGFTKIVDEMDGPIDNTTFLEAARKQTALDTGGKTPPLDLSQVWAEGPATLKGMRNRSVSYITFDDEGTAKELEPRFDDMSELLVKYVKE
jgi:hypothetical protein